MNRNHVADRLTLRALMMQYVVKRNLDGARERLLLNLIKTYFKLDPGQQESFQQMLSRPEFREVQEMELTWEEEVMEKKSASLEGIIEERLISAYRKIRANALNGLAVVPVERDACGGCFNKIPPQRQLDIASRKKIIVCEYCGRILVDSKLSEEKA